MPNVLNPPLYKALLQRFRRVEISDPGSRRVCSYVPDWGRSGRLRADASFNGEYYRVSCPYCSDTRQRLWINHQWAELDERTGQRNLHLANCFNESCLQLPGRPGDLYSKVYPIGHRLQGPIYHSQQPATPEPPREFQLPDGLTPVNQLPHDHHAAVYLAGRGFDVDTLWTRFQVSYCAQAPTAEPPIRDRIVVPIYEPRQVFGDSTLPPLRLAGWQSRLVRPDLPGERKYLTATGTRKSKLLYNLPAAVDTAGPVIVVEGVADVWKAQGNAVALLGKDFSSTQVELLNRYFAYRPIVIFLDGDAVYEARNGQKLLRHGPTANFRRDKRVVIAELPLGRKDVAECSFDEVWNQVALALGLS